MTDWEILTNIESWDIWQVSLDVVCDEIGYRSWNYVDVLNVSIDSPADAADVFVYVIIDKTWKQIIWTGAGFGDGYGERGVAAKTAALVCSLHGIQARRFEPPLKYDIPSDLESSIEDYTYAKIIPFLET